MKEPLPIPPTPQVQAMPGYGSVPHQAMVGGYQHPIAGYQSANYQQVIRIDNNI